MAANRKDDKNAGKKLRGKQKLTAEQSDYEFQSAELNHLLETWKRINEQKAKGEQYNRKELQYLQKNYSSIAELESKIESIEDKWLDVSEGIEDTNDRIKSTLENFDAFEDSINSITKSISKQPGLYELTQKKLEGSKLIVESISSVLQNANDLTDNQIENIVSATQSYKSFHSVAGDAMSELQKGSIGQQQYNEKIIEAYSEFQTLIDKIDTSTESGKLLYNQLLASSKEMKSFSESAKKTEENFSKFKSVMDQFDGVPIMREFSNVIESSRKGADALKLSIMALGAAAGALAGSYFGAEFDAGLKIANDIKQTQIDGERERLKLSNDRNFIDSKIGMEVMQSRIDNQNELNRLDNEKNFAAERASNQFAAQMKSSTVQFVAASKTALFGDKLGGVGYGAAQLQLAGIGAEKIAEQMATAGDVMGSMPTSKIASDMAVMATRTGVSSEAIAQLTKSFTITDGLSTEVALNMQEGFRAMAKSANLPLNTLMQEVADASKEMIGYQIRSTSNLAKQVAFTKSMGVNFNEVAKAGRSMVTNYKDSIKAEMQLSAMLGKSVDLSEVRSKFATGDVKGALESLKAQGLNPEDMSMFQQDALSQALGGLDLGTLKNIATQTGKNVSLGAGNAVAGNQSFLSRTQAAQSALATQEALISADQAIIDAKLSQKITEAYLTSTGYKTYQDALIEQQKRQSAIDQAVSQTFQKLPEYASLMAQETKLAIERNFTEGWAKMLGGAIGAIAGMALTKMLPSGGGGFGDILTEMIPGKRGGKALKPIAKIFGKKAAVNLTDDVAKIGMKRILGNVAKGAVKGGIGGIIGAATSMAGDYFGGQRETAGLMEGDRSKVNQGKGLKVGAKALEYGAYGATIGSIFPGIGTAVGGAVGATVGGLVGVWDNWFSQDAKEKEAQLQKLEQQKEQSIQPNNAELQNVAETSKLSSIVNTIKNNDDIRGKIMYGQDKIQTAYLAKSFDRSHKTMQVAELQLTIMKQTRDLQEITVEFLAEMLKKQEVSPKIALDGKVLNAQLFDRGQRSRIIGTGQQ